ncbi:hypothetical protein HFD88_009749 [Aspergillus terreus]|nr:hypothetical protein HFD88_009749 [Aspergillus terreus]
MIPILCLGALLFGWVLFHVHKNLISSPLRHLPGPKSFALTKWRLGYEEYRGMRTHCVNNLHKKYGEVVRVSPYEVSFSSLSALRKIYGSGSRFERDDFYQMFDAYDRKVLFSYSSGRDHRERKKILNSAYTKTAIMSPSNVDMIEEKVEDFLALVQRDSSATGAVEIFSALHYFAMDSVSHFVYGATSPGRTTAMKGTREHRGIIDDMLDPARRKLFWYAVFWPRLTEMLYAQGAIVQKSLASFGLLPMKTPTYTGLREHNFPVIQHFKTQQLLGSDDSLASRLLAGTIPSAKASAPMDTLDVAAECSDHFLAGIDTTSNTLMWAIYQLSRPENEGFQSKLRAEIQALDGPAGSGTFIYPEKAGTLPYLDAVIRETLRLHAPSPGSEPRWSTNDEIIDGYTIPRGTVVSISPYTLHRQPQVFANPLRFDPERWLGPEDQVAERKRWFWAFSSGARMCIGVHLAMAEVTTLLANIYQNYWTHIPSEYLQVSPGMSARGDLFYDEHLSQVEEHKCWIQFVPIRALSTCLQGCV